MEPSGSAALDQATGPRQSDNEERIAMVRPGLPKSAAMGERR